MNGYQISAIVPVYKSEPYFSKKDKKYMAKFSYLIECLNRSGGTE